MIHHGHISRPHLGSALLAMGCVWLAAIPASAATFVVDSNGDAADASPGDGTCATAAGVCTLRAAIQEHNALGGADAIHFNLSPLQAIRPATALPPLFSHVVLDGTTQPGFAGTPVVVLDGVNSSGGGETGLMAEGNCVIRGLVIVNWETGIYLPSAGGFVTVAGNYIGVGASGSSAQPNGVGIFLDSSDVTIGGPVPSDRNVISGNQDAGITAICWGCNYVTIQGNYIGTDATGTLALPNRYGVYAEEISGGHWEWAIEDNLISGNTEFGIEFFGRGGSITGNYIGTDASGTYAIPNNSAGLSRGFGIAVSWSYYGGSGPTVGGTGVGDANVISGNMVSGLVIRDNVQVMGNYIGTAADGVSPLSNLGNGIEKNDDWNGPSIIGGVVPGARNVIAFNAGSGIAATSNHPASPIRANSIHSNGGLGIDLDSDGPTNPIPVLTRAVAGVNRISGTLQAAASTTYLIDVYANTSLDPTGYGEGEIWLGSLSVLTDGSGHATFDMSLGTPLVEGQFITATATSTLSGTTEFSLGLEVEDGCLPGSGPCCDAGGHYLPAGTECRAAAGPCDAAEICSGASADCPVDALLPPGTTCRAAAGDCDAAESCAGDSAACPADLLLPDTVACRPAAGACDLAERCTGLTPACPPDALQPVSIECRAASCLDGLETQAASCTGASGTCPEPATRACAPYACGAEACLVTCGSSADCAPGFACDAGLCRSPGALGDPCLTSAECQSAHCVDGVCCDGPCAGQCEACDLTGAEGACSLVTGAPHGERTPCAADGSDCGGVCDGSDPAACAYPGDAVPCREASCTDAVAVLPASCQGTGACPAEQTQACAPADCDGEFCGRGCTLDADCAAGEFCAAGVCVEKLTQGWACAGDHQCLDGPCTDGFCCDSSCAGQCEACDVAGSEGTCSPAEGAPHGGRAGCAGQGACQGICDGTAREGCAFPVEGVACSPTRCENFLTTLAGTCDGAGTCSAATQISCVPYVCGEDGCLTTCQSSMDCVGGHECVEGECRPFAPEASSGCGQPGAPGGSASIALLLLAGLALQRRRRR